MHHYEWRKHMVMAVTFITDFFEVTTNLRSVDEPQSKEFDISKTMFKSFSSFKNIGVVIVVLLAQQNDNIMGARSFIFLCSPHIYNDPVFMPEHSGFTPFLIKFPGEGSGTAELITFRDEQ